MFLFERSVSYQSDRIGLRDTIARFIHDLATAGVPMPLASVKAATDAVGRKRKPGHFPEACGYAAAKVLPLILPIGPLAGLS